MLDGPLEPHYRDDLPNEQKPILLYILPVVFFLVVGWPIWQVNRPPFSPELLKQLAPGMSKAAVLEILPEPTEIEGSTWSYSRKHSRPIIYLYFDENGRFRSSEYDD